MVNLQDSKHPDVLKHLYYCVNFSIFPLNVWFHADKTRAVLPTWAAFKNCQGKHFITLFIFDASKLRLGFPGGTSGKESDCQCRKRKRHGFDPWFRKIPWRRAGQVHCRTLAWSPWTEEPGGLQSLGSQGRTRLRVLRSWRTSQLCG